MEYYLTRDILRGCTIYSILFWYLISKSKNFVENKREHGKTDDKNRPTNPLAANPLFVCNNPTPHPKKKSVCLKNMFFFLNGSIAKIYNCVNIHHALAVQLKSTTIDIVLFLSWVLLIVFFPFSTIFVVLILAVLFDIAEIPAWFLKSRISLWTETWE